MNKTQIINIRRANILAGFLLEDLAPSKLLESAVEDNEYDFLAIFSGSFDLTILVQVKPTEDPLGKSFILPKKALKSTPHGDAVELVFVVDVVRNEIGWNWGGEAKSISVKELVIPLKKSTELKEAITIALNSKANVPRVLAAR